MRPVGIGPQGETVAGTSPLEGSVIGISRPGARMVGLSPHIVAGLDKILSHLGGTIETSTETILGTGPHPIDPDRLPTTYARAMIPINVTIPPRSPWLLRICKMPSNKCCASWRPTHRALLFRRTPTHVMHVVTGGILPESVQRAIVAVVLRLRPHCHRLLFSGPTTPVPVGRADQLPSIATHQTPRGLPDEPGSHDPH